MVQDSLRTQHIAAFVNLSVKRLVRRLRQERLDHGVSSSKLNVLGHLARNGPMTATDLAALDRIQPQSLTRMLATLEDRGLIQRQPALTDRRQVQIMITGAGKALLAYDSKRQEAWLSRVMTDTLTEQEQTLLSDAARLLNRLAEMSDSEAFEDA